MFNRGDSTCYSDSPAFQQEICFRHLFASAYEGNSTTAITGLQFTNADSTRVNSLLRIARNLFRACWNFWVSHEYFELFVNACYHRGTLENLSSLTHCIIQFVRLDRLRSILWQNIWFDSLLWRIRNGLKDDSTCRFSFFFMASRRSFDVDECCSGNTRFENDLETRSLSRYYFYICTVINVIKSDNPYCMSDEN